jgi:hypothetical protein
VRKWKVLGELNRSTQSAHKSQSPTDLQSICSSRKSPDLFLVLLASIQIPHDGQIRKGYETRNNKNHESHCLHKEAKFIISEHLAMLLSMLLFDLVRFVQ